jgi:hypothetical protein
VLPEALRKRIASAAAGNALFAEQLVAYAVEGGLEELDSVPPSLDALLSSRLDRLPEAERGVLERAAVVGREFWRGAVSALSERDVDAELASLSAKRFVRAAPSTLPDEEALRFHHVLIREVAYAAITKERRAILHERIAGWLDEREPVADEVIGYHLEQAYVLARALRRDGSDQLAQQAAARLANAGMRAFINADATTAAALLGRATALLPRDDETRIELLIELALARREPADARRALDVLREAESAAAATHNERLRLRARLELLNLESAAEPEAAQEELVAAAERAIPVFERAGDDRALGRAWILVGDVRGARHGHNAEWAAAAERALTHYVRHGWPPLTPIQKLAAALYHGPEPVPSALDRCSALLALAEGHPYAEASVRAIMGALHGQRCAFDDGRRLIAEAARDYEQLGWSWLVASVCESLLGGLELLAGDYVAAERALAVAASAPDAEHSPWRLARLAEAVYAQGRIDEARALCRECAVAVGRDDSMTQAMWRAVDAKALAASGDAAAGEELARAAIALLEDTDGLNYKAKVRADLAVVLQIAGRFAEAADVARAALELYRRKGNVAGARAVRRLTQELTD